MIIWHNSQAIHPWLDLWIELMGRWRWGDLKQGHVLNHSSRTFWWPNDPIREFYCLHTSLACPLSPAQLQHYGPTFYMKFWNLINFNIYLKCHKFSGSMKQVSHLKQNLLHRHRCQFVALRFFNRSMKSIRTKAIWEKTQTPYIILLQRIYYNYGHFNYFRKNIYIEKP